MKKFAIIVAGGSGTRMGTAVPKQFLPLGDSYILMCTIQKFYQADKSTEIVLVLPPFQIAYWKKLCKKQRFIIKHQLAEGGKTRFHSVKNGLKLIASLTKTSASPKSAPLGRLGASSDLVAVHDGVRPFVSVQLIDKTYQAAQKFGNAIPATTLNESLRKIKSNKIGTNHEKSELCFAQNQTSNIKHQTLTNHSLDRTSYRLIQTPQCFSLPLLQKAYRQRYQKTFTDDASVIESIGIPINLVGGETKNIKITTPEDMLIAEAFWTEKTSKFKKYH